MFNDLTAVGYGIVVLGVLIGVGSVVLYNFGTSTACSSTFTFNSTAKNCYETANSSHTTAASQAYTNTDYLETQLGSSGLAGWTPAIIAISVGLLFLGAFLVGKTKRK